MSTTNKIIIEFIIVYFCVFLFNYIFFVHKSKKLNPKDMPLELIYLSGIYGIDPQKINFKQFQYTYSLLNAFIITTTYILVTYLIKIMLLKIILGIIILILLIIICYGLLGRYYIYKENKSTKKHK